MVFFQIQMTSSPFQSQSRGGEVAGGQQNVHGILVPVINVNTHGDLLSLPSVPPRNGCEWPAEARQPKEARPALLSPGLCGVTLLREGCRLYRNIKGPLFPQKSDGRALKVPQAESRWACQAISRAVPGSSQNRIFSSQWFLFKSSRCKQ